jgi:predicted DNA-binding transcriptional regulator AlpA
MTHRLADSRAYPPRAMRLEVAAAYLSISTSSFLRMVEDGDLPPATKKRGIALWDRLDLDAAFDNWKAANKADTSVHEAMQDYERRRKLPVPKNG